MTLDTILYNRKWLVSEVAKKPPSPARSALIKLIRTSNDELIRAAANSWFSRNYGVCPFETAIKLPASLTPQLTNQDEMFQWVTDNLKKSI